tara:strand:- start:1275 stop:1481 length:207 start_codon:yes stop_codon:yes gene_type:complete
MPHMYNHTEPNRVITKPTKKGMKTHTMPNGDVHTGAKHSKSSKLVKKAKPVKKKKMKPMGKVKKTISY